MPAFLSLLRLVEDDSWDLKGVMVIGKVGLIQVKRRLLELKNCFNYKKREVQISITYCVLLEKKCYSTVTSSLSLSFLMLERRFDLKKEMSVWEAFKMKRVNIEKN